MVVVVDDFWKHDVVVGIVGVAEFEKNTVVEDQKKEKKPGICSEPEMRDPFPP